MIAPAAPGAIPVRSLATMRQEAHELHLALQRAKEHGSYVVVGHSLDGMAMQVFANLYPDETAGTVLVDATSPDTTRLGC